MEERSDVLAQARVGIARLGAVLLLGMALVLAPTAAASLTGTDVVVPTSASAGGAYGSYWMTTLWVTNGSMAPTDVEMAFLERDVSNTAPVLYRVTMAPGESRSWEDAVKTLFGKTGTAGAIRLRSTNDVLVVSRTYNDAGGDISNSVGTSLEAVPAGMGAGIGRTTTFLGVTPDGSGVFRYNFGLVEVDGKAVTLRIVLRDGAGSLLGSVEAPVRALEMKQYAVSDLFPGATAPTAAVDVTVTAGNGRVVGFSTLIPNGSNSPTGFGMSLDTQSFIGPQGIAGPQGPAGATGQQGIQGVAGAQGPAGPMGAQGAHGLKGDTGTQGSAGSIGPQGPGGSTGAAGTAGATGPQGIQGPIGSTGPQGTAGIAGQTIIANKAVLNGNADPTTGQGIVGDYYVNTQTNYVFGPKTSEGWPAAGVNMVGPIGPTGLQGPVGTQGIQGSAGAAGQTGPQGPTGAQGAQGIAGQTVIADRAALNGAADPTTQGVDGDYYVNTATNVLFGPKAGSTWPKVGVNMVGPQGPAGATGPQGIQGVVGAQGSKGDTGVQGVAGSTGPQGSAGVAGAAGTAGAAGAQGIQGPTGSTGPQGTAGVAGQTVIAGKAVLSGSVDPSTSQGSDGDYYVNTATNFLFGPKSGTWPTAGVNMIGPIGPTGLQGAVGPQGVAGSTGAAGQTGPQGATGAQGPQGIAGQTVIADRAALNGAADPTTQGVDGDYYVNTATNVLFGPKSGSTWPTVGVNMVGPQGPQGVAGAQGATGPQGSAGSTGQQGIQGVAGAQGATGARGETGTSPFTLNGVDAVYTAGSLGVGVSPPNSAAALEVASTTKGFLPPRMTKAERDLISSPVAGLLIYQSDYTAGLYQYSAGAWGQVGGSSGTVTNVTASSPLSSSGGATPNITLSGTISDSSLDTIATAGKVSNSATTATSANTASTIVARDSSGNFTAGTITATSFSGPLTGNVTGSVTGSSASLSAASALPGGTTATTQTAGDSSTKVATTAYADTAAAGRAAKGANSDITALTGLTGNLTMSGTGTLTTGTGAVALNGNTTLAAGKTLALSGATSGTATLQAPATVTTYALTLPAAAGSDNQVLTTDATGVLSWTSPAGYTLPVATSGTLGGVKPDGTSILNASGVISATAASVGALAATAQAADSAKLGGEAAASYARLASPTFTGTVTAPAFAGALTGNVTGNVSGTAGGLSSTLSVASGGTGQTTAAAAFNALSPITTLGDLVYGSAENTGSRLAGNTTSAKQFLSQTGNGSVSAAPAWTTLSATDVSGVAPLASPAFTGTPTAPTATASDNSTQIATTAFVTTAVSATTNASNLSTGTLNAARMPALTGDVTSSVGTVSTTVGKINGVALSGLATGILKNTTSTGVPSIAAAADFPTLNQDTTGTAAAANALKSATTTVSVSGATAPSSGQVLTATGTTAATWQTPASSPLVSDGNGNTKGGTEVFQTTSGPPVKNTAFGYQAMKQVNSVYGSNSAFGYRALGGGNGTPTTVTGTENVAIGADTLKALATGSSNTAVGMSAGNGLNAISSGDSNTFIGAYAYSSSATASNRTAVGYAAMVDANNKVVLGDENVTLVQFGSYVSSNSSLASVIPAKNNTASLGSASNAWTGLYLAGSTSGYIALKSHAAPTTSYTLTLPGTAGSVNQVLTTDGSGTLSWATPSATTATNLAGGVAGAVHYQSASGTSGFSAAGTSGQVLVSGATGAPTWTTNIAGSAANVTGIVAVANGGTGLGTYTANDILYYSSGTTLSRLANGTDNQVLTATTSGAPKWAAASATTATNLAGGSLGTIPYQSNVGTTAQLAVGTSGYFLQSNGANAPSWAAAAPLNSPAFTGTPTAPTATATDNTTKLATTEFVTTAVSSATGLKSATTTVSVSAANAPTTGQVLMATTASTATWQTPSGSIASDTSGNTKGGTSALAASSTSSWENTAFGLEALKALTGTNINSNSAFGAHALPVNTGGLENTAVGTWAGSNITTGSSNTVVGKSAGNNLTTGSKNTFIGAETTVYPNTSGDFTNSTALGFGATITASNQMVLGGSGPVLATNPWLTQVVPGRTNVTSLGTATNAWTGLYLAGNTSGYIALQAPAAPTSYTLTLPAAAGISGQYLSTDGSGNLTWGTLSDRRLKQDIVSSGLGLDFILKLRPVTYSLISQPTVTQEGLIAQEVEASAQSLGTIFHGVKVPATPDGYYSITYSDFVMPLINAAKELKAENDQLRSDLDTLKSQMAAVLSALGK